jgi:hypothetical protein
MKKAIVLATLLFVVAVLVSACDSTTRIVRPTLNPRPTATTYFVEIRCQGCADMGMEINIWANTFDKILRGSVPHGTIARVHKTYTRNGIKYYEVTAGGIRGLVSEEFIHK